MIFEYDEGQVNKYLSAVNKDSYQISENDADYEVWLEYLSIQNFFDYNEFENLEAGIALIRYYYINAKNCIVCDCFPNLLATLAFGGDQFFAADIYNYKKPAPPCHC